MCCLNRRFKWREVFIYSWYGQQTCVQYREVCTSQFDQSEAAWGAAFQLHVLNSTLTQKKTLDTHSLIHIPSSIPFILSSHIAVSLQEQHWSMHSWVCFGEHTLKLKASSSWDIWSMEWLPTHIFILQIKGRLKSSTVAVEKQIFI